MPAKHVVLWIGGFELASGSGVFAILDFHKMDVPLVRSELTGVSDPGQGNFAGADAESLLSPLHPALF